MVAVFRYLAWEVTIKNGIGLTGLAVIKGNKGMILKYKLAHLKASR